MYVAAAIISLVVAFATGSIVFIGFDIFAILLALTFGASHASRADPALAASPQAALLKQKREREDDAKEQADDYSTDDTLYMVIFSITVLLALATFIF